MGRGLPVLRKVSALLLGLVFVLAFQVGSAFASSKLDDTIDKLIGIDYKYGGTTTKGFDCSGFTGYVFDKLGIDLPRSSRDMFGWDGGTKVDRDELRAGDLVFFNTSGSGVSHVGIYVGNNKFAHSHSAGVAITSMDDKYYAKRYLGARRVMSTETYKKLATEAE
ncbi:NlpC/P60 family protein [Cohnella faecalis]|uniref:NlpC/P60 family protein n=1 Tax=Cohnella faecalis TaxID=2315694 RepID=A0A398CJR0_9BACL|nr:NlpC/P60 family protein [Cohnella faecalis]